MDSRKKSGRDSFVWNEHHKPPLLTCLPGKLINLHLGLSPYYRGSGTNFWPLVDRLPECVGATIHLAVSKVDAGDILAQLRPHAEIKDRAHDLGTKTIMTGVDLMCRIVGLYLEKRIQARPQILTRGRAVWRKDFHVAAVRQMWQNFETGMMEEYFSQADERLRRYPIVELSAVAG